MKANLEVYPFYWHRRWTPYHLYVCTVNKPWGAKKDHRITKAISLTRKKKMEVSNMEAGQLLVLLLSFCALALHIKNRRRKD